MLCRRTLLAVRQSHTLNRRGFSTPNSANAPPNSSSNSRFTRLVNRTPKFLHPTVSALRNAPITHLTAFLLLHEITAIIPLFGLAGSFHYYHWLPPYFAEGAWVVAGVEKFGRYFKRKGWIGSDNEAEVEREAKAGEDLTRIENTKGLKWWNRGEGGMRWVVEFATAYAIVKALLPIRILVSVWGAPWFARWTVIPVGNVFKRLFSKKAMGPSKASPIAGTNAVGANKSSRS